MNSKHLQWQKDFNSCFGGPKVSRKPAVLTGIEKRTAEDDLEDIAVEYKREFSTKNPQEKE